MPSSPQWGLWLLFPFFFVGMWLLVSFTISLKGWAAFAARYGVRNRPSGMAYTSPFTRFGEPLARYGNVVQIIFADTGLYFYPIFLFRAFHPPFLVPWESVKRVEKKKVLFWVRYQLEIEDSAGEIHVTMPVSIENDLRKYHRTP